MNDSLMNLSSHPFLNRRPVQRFRLALWCLGLVLLILNVSSYLRNLSDSTDLRGRGRDLDGEIAVVEKQIAGHEEVLEQLGPEKQNSRVQFLNERIEERTFPWGELFDDIGEVLPREVRLRNLSPKAAGERNAGTQAPERAQVALSVTGFARSDLAVYELVNALFAHPRFASPELLSERRQESGQVLFALKFFYLPSSGVGSVSVAESERQSEESG